MHVVRLGLHFYKVGDCYTPVLILPTELEIEILISYLSSFEKKSSCRCLHAVHSVESLNVKTSTNVIKPPTCYKILPPMCNKAP